MYCIKTTIINSDIVVIVVYMKYISKVISESCWPKHRPNPAYQVRCTVTWLQCRLSPVFLQWDPNDVTHCRILPTDKTTRWLAQTILCRRWCRCLADQLWLLNAYATTTTLTYRRPTHWKKMSCSHCKWNIKVITRGKVMALQQVSNECKLITACMCHSAPSVRNLAAWPGKARRHFSGNYPTFPLKKSIRPVKKYWVMRCWRAWLSVSSEVQMICIWFS